MRILRPIVETATDLVPIRDANFIHRRRTGPKTVCDDDPRSAVFLHDPLEKLQRSGLVSIRRDHCLRDVTFVIHRAPEIAELAVDSHEHLIQTPPPLWVAAHLHDLSLADLSGEYRAEPVPPEPDGFVTDVDTPLGQERSDSGNRTYIITTRRMTSGELLKYRNGLPMARAYHKGLGEAFWSDIALADHFVGFGGSDDSHWPDHRLPYEGIA
jgi:hypothetical protein